MTKYYKIFIENEILIVAFKIDKASLETLLYKY